MYIATASLCACGGCHNSLLSAGEPLVALLGDNTISFSSMLSDQGQVSPSDIVLVTGGISTEEESRLAGEISRNCRKVLAVGSCAVYGGVPGVGRRTGWELRKEPGLPRLLDEVSPLDSEVPVELYVPGCPPPPNLLFGALKSMVEGAGPHRFEDTVCSECPRTVTRGPVESWDWHPGCDGDGDVCLLSRGMLCLGPVTRGGCLAKCTAAGSICIGCRGPSDMVLASQMHSLHSDMVRFVSLTTGVPEHKIEGRLLDMLRSVYMFTRRDPVTIARPREAMNE
jgi:F420-non-reducing hydrogenase small subunit